MTQTCPAVDGEKSKLKEIIFFFKLQNCSPKKQKFAFSFLSSSSPSSSRPEFLELTPDLMHRARGI